MNKIIIKKSCRAVITALLVSTVFPSCSNLGGQGVVREKISEFDGAKSITMSSAGVRVLKGSTTGIYPNLGALWNTQSPNHIGLVLEQTGSTGVTGINSPLYVNIKGLDINTDGKLHRYNTRSFTDHNSARYSSVSGINTSSSNQVIVPLSVVRNMMSANRCVLRVRTNKGSAELDFTRESIAGVKMAKAHMRKFLAQVEAAK
ncbi:MAG: hypothetical protein ACSHX0_12290 [Akkermansiaceae bacterium]